MTKYSLPTRYAAVFFAMTVMSSGLTTPADAQDTSDRRTDEPVAASGLTGQLTDTRSRVISVGRAAVFLLDGRTGLPIDRETKKPISVTRDDLRLDKLWVAETDERSLFEFKDVPAGKYRLVAQSWSGTEGFPGFDVNRQPSAFLILHGIAEDVEVRAGEQTVVYPKQLGHHVLRIVNDPEEASALLLISLRPTAGDAILGPYGWGKQFMNQLIGATQMEEPYVTIIGLPDNAAVHVALANYDNSPGFATGSYEAGQREGPLRIVAGWSNAHRDPPPELKPLVQHLEGKQIKLSSFLSGEHAALEDTDEVQRALLDQFLADNDRTVEVPGLGSRRLGDVLAAYAYLSAKR